MLANKCLSYYEIGDFYAHHNQIILNRVYCFEVIRSKGDRRHAKGFV